MPGYDDSFQSYSPGDSVPIGSWILDPGAFTNVIVAGGGPSGTTQSLQLFGTVAVDPGVTGFQTSFTEFVAVEKTSAGQILAFSNGPNLTGHTFTLLAIWVEQDGTLTARDPDGNPLGNSVDVLFNFSTSNFLQVNLTLSDVTILGIKYVHLHGSVTLNGKTVITFDADTTAQVTELVNATSEINRFQFSTNGANYAAFTLQGFTSVNDYPHPGTPKGRVNQGAIEIVELPDSGKLRIVQGAIELILDVQNRWYISES